MSSMAAVTIYPGVYFYGGNLTLSFQSETNMTYLEVGTNYFVIDSLNLSMVCTNNIDINVSSVNSSINLTSGTSVLRFNATYTTGSVTFTFTGNHTNSIYKLYTDSVLTSTHEVNSFSWSYNSWSEHDFDIRLDGYRPDPPYNGSSEYNGTSNRLNLSWTRGNYSDRDVVVRQTGSYPSSPSDGTIAQNDTALFYNESIFSSGYYTVWSYNDTTNTFSLTGENIPWGAVGITVYNESASWEEITPFGLLISNSAGTNTYQNGSCSGTHYLDLLDIPYGDDTVFVVNATGYIDRTFYNDLAVNSFYNFTFYLAPFETEVDPGGGDPGGSGTNYSTTQNYIINIINDYDEDVSNAKVVVRRYFNNTDSWDEVFGGITDAYGQISSCPLVPGTLYKVNVSCIGYDTLTGMDWRPNYIVFTEDRYKTFRLTGTAEDITTVTFSDICTLSASWVTSNSTLMIFFYDSYSETLNSFFEIYEVYNDTSTLNVTYSYSSNSDITIFVSGLNTSRMHRITLEMNHTTLGHVTNQSVWVGPLHVPTIDEDWLETKASDAFGVFELGWVNMFLLWGPAIIILCGLASIGHPGLGIIGAGLYEVLIVWKIDTALDIKLGALVSILLILGVISLIIHRKRKGG